MSKTEEEQLAEIVKLADQDICKDRYTRIPEYFGRILAIVEPLKNCDEVYCAKSFAYDSIGYYYVFYGDHFSANSYLVQAMKYADRISENSAFRVLGKTDIYLHFYLLYSHRKNLADFWFKEWHNFLMAYLKHPDQLKQNKSLYEVFWSRYVVFADVKMKYLIKNNRIDDAVSLLSEFESQINKFYPDPDAIPGYFSLNNTAAVIYSLKNDSKKMAYYAEKAVKLAEKRGFFPEKSFFLLIRYHMEHGNYQVAEKYCSLGLVLCDHNKIRSDIRWKIDLWILLADIHWKCKYADLAKICLSEAEKLKPPPDLMDKIRKKRKEWF